MTEIFQLFTSNGLAFGLVVLGALFAYFKFWPWWVKRMESKDAEEVRRHNQYLVSIERSNQLVEKFTNAILAVNMTMQATAQLISDQTNKMDEHHEEVMRELRGEG